MMRAMVARRLMKLPTGTDQATRFLTSVRFVLTPSALCPSGAARYKPSCFRSGRWFPVRRNPATAVSLSRHECVRLNRQITAGIQGLHRSKPALLSPIACLRHKNASVARLLQGGHDHALPIPHLCTARHAAFRGGTRYAGLFRLIGQPAARAPATPAHGSWRATSAITVRMPSFWGTLAVSRVSASPIPGRCPPATSRGGA